MSTTLPSLTEVIDQAFMSTWYTIRPDVMDNITESNVVWAALKGAGCLKTQVGERFITREVSYGVESTKAVAKGDTFSQGETEYDTMAMWNWRYESAHVQRSIFDDQINNGKKKIKDLVQRRLTKAREALNTTFESNLFRALTVGEGGKSMQGLNDLIPPYDATPNASQGTYGKLNRAAALTADSATNVYSGSGANGWWSPKYKALTTPIEVNLLSDMKTLYNSVGNNQEFPNLIITDQYLYELYEDFVDDKTQIVIDESTKLANLGFEVLRFRGKPFVWTPNSVGASSKHQMLMVNTNYVDIVYDPSMWFSMSPWKDIPLQGERIAHIFCACNMVGNQARRHGRLFES